MDECTNALTNEHDTSNIRITGEYIYIYMYIYIIYDTSPIHGIEGIWYQNMFYRGERVCRRVAR